MITTLLGIEIALLALAFVMVIMLVTIDNHTRNLFSAM